VERFTVRSDDLGVEPIDDEMLVIDFVTNHYYCLNSTAATIWSMLAVAPGSIDEIADRVAGSYDRPVGDLRDDVEVLVVALADEGLLTTPAEPVDAPIVEPAVGGGWIVPRFEKFGTLDQLMLAGE
jgi:Coenzyme PQQ synthesis protein D (PqqD)